MITADSFAGRFLAVLTRRSPGFRTPHSRMAARSAAKAPTTPVSPPAATPIRARAARETGGDSFFLPSRATRILSVGAYLDPKFRDSLIRQVLLDSRHRVAPSYGFDLIPVVEHAKRALVIDLFMRFGIAAILVCAWIVSPAYTVAACCVIGLWAVGRQIVRSVPQVARMRLRGFPRRAGRRGEQRKAERELLPATAMGLLLLAVPFGTVLLLHQALSETLRTVPWTMAALAATVFLGAAIQRLALNKMYTSTSVSISKMSRRERTIDEQQRSPYVVYPTSHETDDHHPLRGSGFEESPSIFIGAGELVHRWQLPLMVTLKATPAARSSGAGTVHELAPFEVNDLIDALRKAVKDSDDPTSLPGVKVSDRIYVEEEGLSDGGRNLLRQPLTPETLRKIINEPFGQFHHYLEICVSATGEVVTTVFLRATVRARTLSLDFAACALTRLPDSYAILGQFGEQGTSSALRAGLSAVSRLPEEVLAIRRLLELPRYMAYRLTLQRGETAMDRGRSGIGTVFSARQDRAVPWAGAVYDKGEIFGHMTTIERRLLLATEDFLNEKGIDTSELLRRTQSILNTTVLNMGGQMQMSDSAIGPNAQIQNHGADRGTEDEET